MTADGDGARRATVGEALSWAIWAVVVLACLALVVGKPILDATRDTHRPRDDGRPASSTPAASAMVIDDPLASDDETEGYWYCWDSGALAPHHFGHRVPHDHLCTWGELRAAGATQ